MPVFGMVLPLPLREARTSGDTGQFSKVATVLADDNRVVTYDRRGYSRSPRPDGWASTSVGEQVEDAAGLLEQLAAEPAVVYGSSNGAIFALELAIAHPEQVRGLILHEPPLIGALADPRPVAAAMSELLEPAFSAIGRARGSFDCRAEGRTCTRFGSGGVSARGQARPWTRRG